MADKDRGSLIPDHFGGPLPRHRHNLTREEVRRSQSARIINAAIELFGKHGYATTSVLDVVKQAGVSRKTFYELFETKEAVVVAAYRAFDQFLRDAGMTTASPSLTAAPQILTPQALHTVARTALETLSAYPDAARMFFLEVLGAGSEVRLRRDEAINHFVDVITPILAELRKTASPGLPPLERVVVKGIVGGCIEMIVSHLVHHTPETLVDASGDIAAFILGVVCPGVRNG